MNLMYKFLQLRKYSERFISNVYSFLFVHDFYSNQKKESIIKVKKMYEFRAIPAHKYFSHGAKLRSLFHTELYQGFQLLYKLAILLQKLRHRRLRLPQHR